MSLFLTVVEDIKADRKAVAATRKSLDLVNSKSSPQIKALARIKKGMARVRR